MKSEILILSEPIRRKDNAGSTLGSASSSCSIFKMDGRGKKKAKKEVRCWNCNELGHEKIITVRKSLQNGKLGVGFGINIPL